MSFASLQTSKTEQSNSTFTIGGRETSIILPQKVRVRTQNGQKISCELEITRDRIRLLQQIAQDKTTSPTNDCKTPLYWFFWCQLRSMLLVGRRLRIKVNHMNHKNIVWCKFVNDHQARQCIQIILDREYIHQCPLSAMSRVHYPGASKYVANRTHQEMISIPIRDHEQQQQNVAIANKGTFRVGSFSSHSETIHRSICWSSTEQMNNSIGTVCKYASLTSIRQQTPTVAIKCSSITPNGSMKSLDDMHRPYSALFDSKPTDADQLSELDYTNILLYRLLDIDYANKEKFQQLFAQKCDDVGRVTQPTAVEMIVNKPLESSL